MPTMIVTAEQRNRIQAAFKAAGIRFQKDVADRCDITEQHLSDVLCGRAVLTRRLARDISRATNIPLSVILGDGKGS